MSWARLRIGFVGGCLLTAAICTTTATGLTSAQQVCADPVYVTRTLPGNGCSPASIQQICQGNVAPPDLSLPYCGRYDPPPAHPASAASWRQTTIGGCPVPAKTLDAGCLCGPTAQSFWPNHVVAH